MRFKKCLTVILFILSFQIGKCWGQERFIATEFPVKDVAVSPLKNQAWFTSGNKIFQLDLKNFKILDSVQLTYDQNHLLTTLNYSDTEENILEVKSQFKDFHRLLFQEYPADTTYYYNVQRKAPMAKIPGNALMTSLLSNRGFVFGWNDFYKDNFNGEEIFNSLVGGLSATTNGNSENAISATATGILNEMEISPDGKFVLLLYYDSYDEVANKYLLELRSFPEMEILKTVSLKTFYTDDLFFSENSQYAGIKIRKFNRARENIYSYLFFTIPDLSSLETTPDDFQYDQTIVGGEIWKMEEGNVVLRDRNGDKIKEIWSNLTPIWSITGFQPIDKHNLIIFGEGSPMNGIPGGKQGLFHYNLQDNAVYSDIGPSNTEVQLFNADEMEIRDNRFSLSNDYKARSIHGNKEKVVIASANKVQLWSIKHAKKLEEWLLDNSSRNFLSKEGNTVLYFEEHKGQTFDEFQIGIVDLETGLARKRIYSGSQEFSPVDSGCECYEQTSNVWICAGGHLQTGIWRITLSDLQIEKIKDFADPQYDYTSILNFQAIPGTSDFLLQLEKENFNSSEKMVSSPGVFSLADTSFESLGLTYSVVSYFPLSAEEFIYQAGNAVFKYSFKTRRSVKLYEVSNYKLAKGLSLSSQTYALFEPDNPSEDFLVVPTASSGLSQSFKLPFSSRFFFAGFDGIVYGSSDNIHTYYPQHDLNIPWNEGKSVYIDNMSLSMDNDGNILFDSKWLVDLKDLELRSISDLKYPSLLLPDGRLFKVNEERYNDEQPHFSFQLLKKEGYSEIAWESEKFAMDYYVPDQIVSSPNGKYVVCYFHNRYQDEKKFFIIDTKSGALVEKQLQHQILDVLFSPDEETVYISQSAPSFGKSNWGAYHSKDLQNIASEIPFSPDAVISKSKFLVRDFSNVSLLKFQDGKTTSEKIFYSRSLLTKTGYDWKNKLVFAGNQEGELILWQEDVSSPLKEFDLGFSEVISVEQKGNKLFVLLKEGKLGIIDLETQELLVNLTIFQNEDKIPTLAWLTPEGYFKAGKNDIRKFHFVKGGEAFPLVNYEIFLNRPDILMEKLGYADPEKIKIYKEAYEKRLARNNIKFHKDNFLENTFSLQLSGESEIPTVTENRQLRLEITAPQEVREIKAYINGVPVHSAQAKKEQTINLALNAGVNEINIVGINKENVESNPLNFSVTTTFEKVSTIHYFGVGVSNYEDTSMNLNYADKDVRKLAATFENKFEGRVNVDTLINANVTKENLHFLKQKLQQTNIDDIVILSFSGHGLVDGENEFYFATHDVDFQNPEERGFSYNDIHDLLNNIPARRKLLLIDACNSGEIDSSQDLEPIALNANVKQRIPEGAKGSKVVKSDNSRGLDDSFEVMKSLFYDLDRGNGAYIIAAAGGREFAYESAEWDNGVFTYSFLKALQDLGYDWGGKETPIKISRLKAYVEEQVLELTNGKQQPTARSENIEWDWELK